MVPNKIFKKSKTRLAAADSWCDVIIYLFSTPYREPFHVALPKSKMKAAHSRATVSYTVLFQRWFRFVLQYPMTLPCRNMFS